MPKKNKKATKPRNSFEESIWNQIASYGIEPQYEVMAIPWVFEHIYTPDFVLPNGILLEGKGQFDQEDRSKHARIKQQHPDLDIRIIFCRSPGSRKPGSATKLSKSAKMTYGDWCDRNRIPYADSDIPEEWIKEKPNKASLKIIEKLKKVG